MGRKIGVVQEILCKKLLSTSQVFLDSVIYEPKIVGRSGASHKVEFVLFQPIEVVEVASSKPFVFAKVPSVVFEVLWTSAVGASLRLKTETASVRATVPVGTLLIGPSAGRVGKDFSVKIVSATDKSVRMSLLDRSAPVASVESKRVGAQRFAGSDHLGSGIQTIEKAKQASLVAVDFDLAYNKTVLPLGGRKTHRRYKSFVVLGNGVHWTHHDKAILETYVDYTFLIKDAAIIRYAEYVRRKAEAEGDEFLRYFMRYFQGMTKMTNDDFEVRADDVELIVPMHPDASLVTCLASQVEPYSAHVV